MSSMARRNAVMMAEMMGQQAALDNIFTFDLSNIPKESNPSNSFILAKQRGNHLMSFFPSLFCHSYVQKKSLKMD